MVGEYIRALREEKHLLLREVAAAVAMDQALLSKIERNERQATRSQVVKLAAFYEIDEAALLSQWLGEKIAIELAGERLAGKALEAAKAILDKHELVNLN